MQGDAGRPQTRRRKEQELSSSHSSKDDVIWDILVTAHAQWRRNEREPPISGAHKGSNLIGRNSHLPKTTWEPVLTVRSSQRVSPKGCVTAEAETAMEGSLHVDFTVPVLSSLK